MDRADMNTDRKAVFLDRDGVLVEDVGLLVDAAEIRILPGVASALRLLHDAGWRLVVVSNQAVVARGLLDEPGVVALQREIESRLGAQGAPALDAFYFCPHHPSATLPAYRTDCACRKPKPGLLLRAAAELGLDLHRSCMIGDRATDLQAGSRAGCRTIWVQTGRHHDPPIETAEPAMLGPSADHVCPSLLAAAYWILEAR
jgi:D-glycero-D-manno-heptose 1,7-bisphosphate phosphatase